MGCVATKYRIEEENEKLRARVRMLEMEAREERRKREKEKASYEECTKLLTTKEAEWKKEKRKCKEEIMALQKKVDEDERQRLLAEATATAAAPGKKAAGSDGDSWLQQLEACYYMEQMKVEQARREEAVEKWKQLYLTIKAELDDLIHKTRQGDRYWGGDLIEGLQRELDAREEMMESLRRRLIAMELEGAKRDREIDILRQSLRILSSSKHNYSRQNLVRSLHP